MNHGDMLDSLVRPVIDEIVSGSTGADQSRWLFYKFKFINRRFNESLVSSTPVFVDTRADVSAILRWHR